MRVEYLLFNIFVIAGPLLAFLLPIRFRRPHTAIFFSVLLVALPFYVWDVLVTGMWWYFNSEYILGVRFLGVPLEEYLFFLTVPFACLLLWEQVRSFEQIRNFKALYVFIGVMSVLIGGFSLLWGWHYTAAVLCGLGVFSVADFFSLRVLSSKKLLYFMGVVTLLTLVFNWYLTARPVVTYNPEVKSNVMVATIPAEDFAFGWLLLLMNVYTYELLRKRKA
jgi:lycopene cyclase domain-containing protein